MSAFNFASISAQLPPNTGPAGTVPVSTGNNANNTNKNLSHVPCKFFRQGVCQAGNSCPFSHNLDGTLAADKLPCKYFQKGNCKFGLKCALAHFLPDGTRVSSKNLMMNHNYNNNNGNNNNNNNSSNNNNGFNSNQPYGQSQNQMRRSSSTTSSNFQNGNLRNDYSNSNLNNYYAPANTSGNHQPSSHGLSSGSQSSQPIDITSTSFSPNSAGINNSLSPVGSGNNNIANFINIGSNNKYQPYPNSNSQNDSANSSFNGNSSLSHTNSLFSNSSSVQPNGNLNLQQISLATGTSLGSNNNAYSITPTQGVFRSYSFNTSPSQTSNTYHANANLNANANSNFVQSPQSASSAYKISHSFSSRLPPSHSSPSYNLSNNDSAIVDDEDEVGDEMNSENGFFEEDYVPGSLGDLILTPQELQRRDSRSQSGTLLVKPNLSSILSSTEEDDEIPKQKTLTTQPKNTDKNESSPNKSSSPHEDVFLME